MSHTKSRDGLKPGPAGDTTTGLINNLTYLGPTFWKSMLQTPEPPPGNDSQYSVKRNPEDIAKQLEITSKKKPLLSSQETIETLKKENLKLKLHLHTFKQSTSNKEIGNFNLEENERDVIAELKEKIEELTRELDERDKKDRRAKKEEAKKRRDAHCQTHLDGNNIEELFKARYIIRKQQEQKLQEQDLEHQRAQQSRQKLFYPNVMLPQQAASNEKESFTQGEKEWVLDQLTHINNMMTHAVKNAKKLKSDTH